MKKFLSILLFNIIFINSLPIFANEKNIKKVRVNTFNKAVENGDAQKVKAYIDAGFDPNKKHWKTWFLYGTPIIGTAIYKKQDSMLDLLLENGASPNPKSLVSPLQVAVVCNNPYAVKRLLDYGADRNRTYMKQTAKQIAVQNGLNEIVSLFDSYNDQNATNLYDAVELLNNPTTINFYDVIKGQNSKNKPYVLRYVNFKNNKTFQETYIMKDHIEILVNSKYSNCSKEALATLIAGASLYTDTDFSINEAAYSTMLLATIWANFLQQNPNLKNNKTLLEEQLTMYSNYLTESDFPLADFKNLIRKSPVYKGLKEESLGFTNEILQLPNDKTIIVRAAENVKKYWQDNNMTDKLINASVFIICTSAIIAGSMWASNNYYTPAPPVVTPPIGTYVSTVQMVPVKVIQQVNIHNGQPLNKIPVYKPVTVPMLRY